MLARFPAHWDDAAADNLLLVRLLNSENAGTAVNPTVGPAGADDLTDRYQKDSKTL